jgi:hypothetical protein
VNGVIAQMSEPRLDPSKSPIEVVFYELGHVNSRQAIKTLILYVDNNPKALSSDEMAETLIAALLKYEVITEVRAPVSDLKDCGESK